MIKEHVDKALKPLLSFKFLTLFLCSINVIVGMAIPYLVGVLLDGINQPLETFIFYISLIAGIVILAFLLNWMQNTFWFNLMYKAANIIRKSLYSEILKKSAAFYKNASAGDLSNKLLNDAANYASVRVTLMPMLFLNLLNIGVVFIILLFMNYLLALVCAFLYLIYFGLYTRLNKRMRNANRELSESFSKLQESALETLNNIGIIKLFCSQNYFAERFGKSVDKHTNRQSRIQFWKSLGDAGTETALGIIPVVAVILGIILLWNESVTIGQIVAFYAFLPMLGEPFRNLSDFNLSFQSVKGLESRLDELLLTSEEKEELNKPAIIEIEKIEFRNLNFCYSDDKRILKDLSLILKKGDTLGIVGESGSGKSTLLKLLTRQLEAQNLFVNEKEINYWSSESFYSRLALLPQEIFIFDGAISDNVRLGRTDGDLQNALNIASIENLSNNVLSFSGGEKQRIGLARAVFENADVLILDEPTSALDENTEKIIIENLRKFLKERNIIAIIVSHRKEILNLCNKLLEL